MEFNVSFRKTFAVCHDVGVPAMVWVTSAVGRANSETNDYNCAVCQHMGECRKHSKYS